MSTCLLLLLGCLFTQVIPNSKEIQTYGHLWPSLPSILVVWYHCFSISNYGHRKTFVPAILRFILGPKRLASKQREQLISKDLMLRPAPILWNVVVHVNISLLTEIKTYIMTHRTWLLKSGFCFDHRHLNKATFWFYHLPVAVMINEGFDWIGSRSKVLFIWMFCFSNIKLDGRGNTKVIKRQTNVSWLRPFLE